MIEKGELATSVEKKRKNKIHLQYSDDAGNNKLLYWLLLSLVCWLMLARRLCVYNAGMQVKRYWLWLWCHITKMFNRAKDSSSLCALFLVIRFALSWPCDSLPWVLISNPTAKWWKECGLLKFVKKIGNIKGESQETASMVLHQLIFNYNPAVSA